jgi:hypothetical protein
MYKFMGEGPSFVGMSGDWQTESIYPFAKWYNTGSNPSGQADDIVESFFEEAFPQFAVFLEAASKALAAQPEQVSIYYQYEHPPTPKFFPKQYAESIPKQFGPIPEGLGNEIREWARIATAESSPTNAGGKIDVREIAVQSVKESAVKSVTEALAVQIGVDVVPMIQLASVTADIVKNYKNILDSEDARWDAGFALTGATAAAFAIPAVGGLVTVAQLVKGIIDFRKAKEEIEKTRAKAENLSKMLKSAVEVAMGEAKPLAIALARVGARPPKKVSAAFRDRLIKHYRKLLTSTLKRSEFDAPIKPYEDALNKLKSLDSEIRSYVKKKVWGDSEFGQFTKEFSRGEGQHLKDYIDKLPTFFGQSSYTPKATTLGGLGAFGRKSIDQQLYEAAMAAQKRDIPYLAPEEERKAAIQQQLAPSIQRITGVQPVDIGGQSRFVRFWKIDPQRLPDRTYRIIGGSAGSPGLGVKVSLRDQYDRIKTSLEGNLGPTVGKGERTWLRDWRKRWHAAWKVYDAELKKLMTSVAKLPKGVASSIGYETDLADWLVKAVGKDNTLRYQKGINTAERLLGQGSTDIVKTQQMLVTGGIGTVKDAVWTARFWNSKARDAYNEMLTKRWGRRDQVRAFLQLARDMRKARLALNERFKAYRSLVFEEKKEIELLANAILKKLPNLPYEVAVALATKFVRGVGKPLTPDLREQIASEIAEQYLKLAKARTEAKKGGLLPLAAAVGGIVLALKG